MGADDLKSEIKRLDEQRKNLREAVRFFGREGSRERELDLCKRFLSAFDIQFEDRDLIPLEQALSPPDVRFGPIRFEVTELLDEGRRRHAEYKQDLARLEAATKPDPDWVEWEPEEFTLDQVLLEIVSRAFPAKNHYAPSVRRSLDLLVYYNRHRQFESLGELPTLGDDILRSGFRSLLVWTGGLAWVVHASEWAPEPLRSLSGQVRHHLIF
jgi:hypothetical protein